MKRLTVLAVALAVLAGCTDAATQDLSGGHDDSDLEFVRGMVPHHDQAVVMARLAATRAQHPEVVELARRIEATQGAERETMRAWLEEWGDDAAAAADPEPGEGPGGPAGTEAPAGQGEAPDGGLGHSHGGRPFSAGAGINGATGMGTADEAELRRLESASGAEFDRAFVELMTEHHQGAIAMATREVGLGRNADAKALARTIRDAQAAELEELRRLRAA